MTDHYFSQQQNAPYTESSFDVTLRNHHFIFLTAPGVFSGKKIDKGSLLLIESAVISFTAQKLLDLGCGYGAVGIALAKSFPKINVVMSDINERAVFLSKKNIKENRIDNAEAKQSDGFEKISDSFDVILLNPPQTAGKKVCEKLITDSFEHLHSQGTLQIVARHQKGGKGLADFMEMIFGNVQATAKSGGYRVYMSEKK